MGFLECVVLESKQNHFLKEHSCKLLLDSVFTPPNDQLTFDVVFSMSNPIAMHYLGLETVHFHLVERRCTGSTKDKPVHDLQTTSDDQFRFPIIEIFD